MAVIPTGWKPPAASDTWPGSLRPYSPWSLTYLTPYRVYQEPPLPHVRRVSEWYPWEQTVPIFQKNFKSLTELSRAKADPFQHISQRFVFRLTKRMPEVLQDPKLLQELQFKSPTAKDADITCIGIRGLRFMLEWPELECTQGFTLGFRQIDNMDPDKYQAITKSLNTLPTNVMASCTSSFLPIRRSPIPNVLKVMYKGFEFDVGKHGTDEPKDRLEIGELYPSTAAPVTRVLDQFTADKAPKVVYCGRSFAEIKKKKDTYPVGYVYDSASPVSSLAFAPESVTLGPLDWGDLVPVVQPHMGQPLVALFNSLYVCLEVLAPMPRWINLSDDQKSRIIAPTVALQSGGQMHLACDICAVKIPASDWQIASGYSTRTPRYSEVSMTQIEGTRTTFDPLSGHPMLAEFEDKPLDLMESWSKNLWKADEYPSNPFINLLQDRVSRGPRAISIHVQRPPDQPNKFHSQQQMLNMPIADYKAEFQHLQDVIVPWEYRSHQHDELTTIQATMLTKHSLGSTLGPPPPPSDDGDDEPDMAVDVQDCLCSPADVSFAYL